MHQAKKGNQWYFGMKAHIGVDVEPGLVDSLVDAAPNMADVTQIDRILHSDETWSVPMPAIQEWRNTPSMKLASSSGRLPPGAAPTKY
ncbi:hypothetical protein EMIT0P258_190057 [Pseudomonas sp. IT-P258]